MNRWVAGARPRTLPAAVVPVVVGTAVASAEGTVVWWRALGATIKITIDAPENGSFKLHSNGL